MVLWGSSHGTLANCYTFEIRKGLGYLHFLPVAPRSVSLATAPRSASRKVAVYFRGAADPFSVVAKAPDTAASGTLGNGRLRRPKMER